MFLIVLCFLIPYINGVDDLYVQDPSISELDNIPPNVPILIQTVIDPENPQMVYDRPLIILVKVNQPTPVTISINEIAASEKTIPIEDQDSPYLFFGPFTFNQNIEYHIEYNIEGVGSGTLLTSVFDPVDLCLYYVPLTAPPKVSKYQVAPLEPMMTQSNEFIKATYPIGTAYNEYGTSLQGSLPKDEWGGVWWDCINVEYEAINAYLQMGAPSGIAPIGVAIGAYEYYFDYHAPKKFDASGIAGMSFESVKGVAVADGYYAAAAHEIGHIFGLYTIPGHEQYQDTAPDGESAYGIWVDENYLMDSTWEGGQDVYCFMGTIGHESTHLNWVSNYVYGYLRNASQFNPVDPEIIVVHGIIDNSTHKMEIIRDWVWYESGTPHNVAEGNMSLMFYASNGTFINETKFKVDFSQYLCAGNYNSTNWPLYGKSNSSKAGFCFATEWLPGTDYIKVYDKTNKTNPKLVGKITAANITRFNVPPGTSVVEHIINFNEKIKVTGYGVTAGATVAVYIDAIQPWDGVSGLLNTTSAKPDGTWKCEIDVPETVQDAHYIWAKDLSTGSIGKDPTAVMMVPSINFSPKIGLIGDTITITGHGYRGGVNITKIEYWDGVYKTITTSPTTPSTDSLGRWTASFTVPNQTNGIYSIFALDEDDYFATENFTIGPSIMISPENGPVGTVVQIQGRGFSVGGSIDVLLDSTLCAVYTGGSISGPDGEFTAEVIVPSLSDGEHTFNVSDGTNEAIYNFEIDENGEAIIIVDPTFGVQGSTVNIYGYNFSQVSGGDVIVELWRNDTYETDIDTFETDSDGEFSGTFTVPARSNGKYSIYAYQPDYNIEDIVNFKIGMVIVILDQESGPSGTDVVLTGTGFEPNASWNATFSTETIIEVGAETDASGNLELNGQVPKFLVPSLPEGFYEVTVMDEEGTTVTVDFEVTTCDLIVNSKKSDYKIGETVVFDITHCTGIYDSYIMVFQPNGSLYWQTDPFSDDKWIPVTNLKRVPYYEQTAGGNPMVLLEDSPLGEWSWEFYDSGDVELDSGTVTIIEEDVGILEQIVQTGKDWWDSLWDWWDSLWNSVP